MDVYRRGGGMREGRKEGREEGRKGGGDLCFGKGKEGKGKERGLSGRDADVDLAGCRLFWTNAKFVVSKVGSSGTSTFRASMTVKVAIQPRRYSYPYSEKLRCLFVCLLANHQSLKPEGPEIGVCKVMMKD